MATEDGRLLVPIPEVCKKLGDVSRTTAYKLVDDGELELVKIGRRSFVTMLSLEAYVSRLSEAATPYVSRD